MQYAQAWEQPRYGLIVQGKGNADGAGTALSALRQRTSCSVIPGNSGTCTLRSRPRIDGMPGSAASSTPSSRCASHRTPDIRTHVRDAVQASATDGAVVRMVAVSRAAVTTIVRRRARKER